VILTDKPDAVEGVEHFDVNGDQPLFETLDKDEEEIENLVWVNYPQSYGFKNRYEYIGNGVSPSDKFQD
jgi:hypothetical protein